MRQFLGNLRDEIVNIKTLELGPRKTLNYRLAANERAMHIERRICVNCAYIQILSTGISNLQALA